MNGFLKEVRKLLTIKDNICIVLGNESCDLDSAVSCLSLAYFYNKNQDKIPRNQTLQMETSSSPDKSESVSPLPSSSSTNCYCASLSSSNSPIKRKYNNILPLFNMKREDFPLKTEVTYFLNLNSINIDLLIFKDDINENLLNNNDLILVDHHVTKYAKSVIAIYDHRPYDDNITSQLPKKCVKNIKLVGSCSTLIAEQILDLHNSKDYLECLHLLYGAIILDTVCFSKIADKATTLDNIVAFEIENLLKFDNPSEYRELLFNDLIKSRNDISKLNSYQLLYKDLKILNFNNLSNLNNNKLLKIALPGFPILIKDYIQMNDAEMNIKKFAEIENVSIIVLIGMKINESDGTIVRDLGVINLCNDYNILYDKLIDVFRFTNEPNLKLEEYIQNNDDDDKDKQTNLDDKKYKFMNGKFFKQNNVKASRKQIVPIIKSVFDDL